MVKRRRNELAGPYQAFILILCVYAIGALVQRSFFPLGDETLKILTYADSAVVANWFHGAEPGRQQDKIVELRDEIRALRKMLEAQTSKRHAK